MKKLKFLMLILFLGFCFAVFDVNSTKADMPLSDKQGACAFCVMPDGTWGSDNDCWSGNSTCIDTTCQNGWCPH